MKRDRRESAQDEDACAEICKTHGPQSAISNNFLLPRCNLAIGAIEMLVNGRQRR